MTTKFSLFVTQTEEDVTKIKSKNKIKTQPKSTVMAHSLNMQNFKYEDYDLEQRESQSSSKHYW